MLLNALSVGSLEVLLGTLPLHHNVAANSVLSQTARDPTDTRETEALPQVFPGLPLPGYALRRTTSFQPFLPRSRWEVLGQNRHWNSCAGELSPFPSLPWLTVRSACLGRLSVTSAGGHCFLVPKCLPQPRPPC